MRAGRFALALLDRPRDQIAKTLWGNWDEQLSEVLGIQPPSGTSNPGPEC
ncbi:MAG: hypothetical protein ACM30G_08460 [Micromonosporaceae bacterium]